MLFSQCFSNRTTYVSTSSFHFLQNDVIWRLALHMNLLLMFLLLTKFVFKFAVSLCFYLSVILFLKVVMTASNITERLVKEKTMDWVNTTFPSKLMEWIVMTIKLVLRNWSDNLRFKPYLFSFLFLHFVGGWHKFWSQACQCLRFLSVFRDFIPGVYSLI